MTQSAAFDIAVIGAGMAGVSAAAELAPYARVLLIESESQPGYHATGRSAAILAQTYGNDVVRALTRASHRFLTAPPEGFAEAPLLTPRGLIRIGRADQMDLLREMFNDLEDTGFLEWVDAAEVERRVPLLRPGYAAGGIVNAAAQDLDVHGMLQGYLRRFRAAAPSLEVTNVDPSDPASLAAYEGLLARLRERLHGLRHAAQLRFSQAKEPTL